MPKVEPIKKMCHVCQTRKYYSEFYKNRASTALDGLTTLCIPCHNNASKRRYARKKAVRKIMEMRK